MSVREMHMTELKDVLGNLKPGEVILDVRRRDEYAAGHLDGAINIPHDEILLHLDELKKYKTIYIHCRSGGRAQVARDVLKEAGLSNFHCVSGGGMKDWMEAGHPVVR